MLGFDPGLSDISCEATLGWPTPRAALKSEDRNPKAERRPSSEIRRPKPERGSGIYCRMSLRVRHLPDLVVFLGNQILVALDILVRFGVD